MTPGDGLGSALGDDSRLRYTAKRDLTHMPNHMNIVVASAHAATGAELGLDVGTRVRLRTPAGGQAAPGGIHVKLPRQG